MKKLLLAIMLPLGMVFATLAVSPLVSAQLDLKTGVESAQGEGAATKVDDPGSLVKSVINILLWVIGVLSVIMLIWGGITYTTSAGDSNKVTSAKNTIIYAVIGLVVAIFAYAIVNFVVLKTSSI